MWGIEDEKRECESEWEKGCLLMTVGWNRGGINDQRGY
jgi:hypothetical protein